MIKAFLNSLEDPEMPLAAPNYWILKKGGLILPENKYAKVMYIFMHATLTYFIFTQFLELYFTRTDLDEVLTNLKISMLSSVCMFKINHFVFRQKQWKEVFDYVTEADNFERKSEDPEKKTIINAYTRYCRRVTYFHWFLILTTVLTTMFQPLMMYLSSSSLREGVRNGTAGFPHIFSSWMPLDKNHFPGYLIIVMWHTTMMFHGATGMAAYDSSVLLIMVFFGGKLDLLRVRCREMLGPSGVGITDREFNAVVKELHHIHAKLIKYSRLFNSLLSPVMFFYILMCSMMLCASAYQLTSASNAAQKLYLTEYFLFGILQLFMFCWHSNDVLVKSENVTLGPYESEWWSAPLRYRKSIILLSGQLRIQNIFSAGPFVNLTLATFITILRGAYSYYTLLNNRT